MKLPEERHHEFVFRGRMNIAYHERLERFYWLLLNWTTFVSLIFSSAAFVALGNWLPNGLQSYREPLMAGIAFSVACLNGIVLAAGARAKWVQHIELKRKWIGFLGFVQAEPDKLADMERTFHELNAQEPAPNTRILNRVFDDTCKAMGLPVHSG